MLESESTCLIERSGVGWNLGVCGLKAYMVPIRMSLGL
jgi:hypothetical protein